MSTIGNRSAISGEHVTAVEHRSFGIYADQDHLTFHNWAHVSFVRDKAVGFAEANGADTHLVEIAALVHDLNYVVRRNSDASAGESMRRDVLTRSGLGPPEIAQVESVIREAEIRARTRHVTLEAQALSDADTLYKILPITPVLFSPEYMRENAVDIFELASKILQEQDPILRDGYLFYSPEAAQRYQRWAEANVELWRCIAESVADGDVQSLMKQLP